MSPAAPAPAPLATVTRRDVASAQPVVESRHLGHLVVVDADGAVVAALGDPQRTTFVRSAAKPFQATACLELLATEIGPADPRLPSSEEIAIAWASHRAEPHQLATVQRLLRRAGTDAAALTCPPARGEDDPAAGPAPLLSDCSGKHALFALVGRRLGFAPDRWLDADGPLQRVVLQVVADAIGPATAIGVDGCGAPAVAGPLVGLARGFAATVTDDRWAAVARAGLAHPDLVGGRGRLETALLAAGTVAKSGAEGVFAAGWCDADGRAHGLAVKAEDGAGRAATAAAAAVLDRLGHLPSGAWSPAPVLGGGRPAGEVVADPQVTALATALAAGRSR